MSLEDYIERYGDPAEDDDFLSDLQLWREEHPEGTAEEYMDEAVEAYDLALTEDVEAHAEGVLSGDIPEENDVEIYLDHDPEDLFEE